MVFKEYVLLLACFVAAAALDANLRTHFSQGLLASILFMSGLVYLFRQREMDTAQIRIRLRSLLLTTAFANGIGYFLLVNGNPIPKFVSSLLAMLVGYFYVSHRVLESDKPIS